MQRYAGFSVPSDKSNDYVLGRTLRKTLYGKVKLALHRSTNTVVAIKLSRADHANRQNLLESPETESSILRLLSKGKGGKGHRHVLRLFDEFRSSGYQWIVLEYAARGELFSFIEHGPIPDDVAKHLLQQIAEGVEYIHQHGVAHLDLSLENVLLNGKDNVKICDFGVARAVTPAMEKLLGPAESKVDANGKQIRPGKDAYMAPEVFNNAIPADARTCDIWSMGVCMFIMLTGGMPWDQPSCRDPRYKYLLKKGMNVMITEWEKEGDINKISKEAIDLLNNMLCPADRRFNIEQVLAHPWFAKEGAVACDADAVPVDAVLADAVPVACIITGAAMEADAVPVDDVPVAAVDILM